MLFHTRICLFHHEDGEALGQVAQRGYKLSVHGGVQNLILSNLIQLSS